MNYDALTRNYDLPAAKLRCRQSRRIDKKAVILVYLGFKIVMNLRHSKRREAGLYLVYCPVSRLRRMARRRAILEAKAYGRALSIGIAAVEIFR